MITTTVKELSTLQSTLFTTFHTCDNLCLSHSFGMKKEMAIKFQCHTILVTMDDKHKVPVGECALNTSPSVYQCTAEIFFCCSFLLFFWPKLEPQPLSRRYRSTSGPNQCAHLRQQIIQLKDQQLSVKSGRVVCRLTAVSLVLLIYRSHGSQNLSYLTWMSFVVTP